MKGTRHADNQRAAVVYRRSNRKRQAPERPANRLRRAAAIRPYARGRRLAKGKGAGRAAGRARRRRDVRRMTASPFGRRSGTTHQTKRLLHIGSRGRHSRLRNRAIRKPTAHRPANGKYRSGSSALINGRTFRHRLAAVVTCRNEQDTLPKVLRQLERLPFDEIIVVINGSTDRSLELASKFRNVTIVWQHEPLGHDIGRAVGARIATADVILFMDGDLPVRAERLVPFLRAVDRGADLALNDLSPYVGNFAEYDQVTQFKVFLNRVLGRPDLAMNSMTAVPHAVSRRLLDTVGIESLAVPPRAQALAIMNGLNITAPGSVDVIRRNRIRPYNVGEGNPVADMIIGDHLEAISCVLQRLGTRGGYPDTARLRHIARGEEECLRA